MAHRSANPPEQRWWQIKGLVRWSGNTSHSVWPYLLVALFGLGVALFRFGPAALTVSHNDTQAKYGGDTLDSLIGSNYLIQDEWRFPLLALPNVAFEEGGGSAINTDSLPLMALLAKLAYQLHPKLYDYQSVWLVLCYVIQALAIVWVVSLRTRMTVLTSLVAAAFALALPAFLIRWPHIPLCSHFLIILGIGAYLQGRSDWKAANRLFALLLLFSLLVTAYLFAMVLGFFAAHLVQGCLDDRNRIRSAVRWAMSDSAVVIAVGVVVGYWEYGRYVAKTGGYGYYSMNLLSPFWPQGSLFFETSFRGIDATGGQYEGINYFGLELILAGAVVVVKERIRLLDTLRRHPVFFAYMVFLFCFAVSHTVYLGERLLFKVPTPQFVLEILNNFRSGGRMFWGVTYALVVFVLIRLSFYGKWWRIAAACLALLQAVEVSKTFVQAPHFDRVLSTEGAGSNAWWESVMNWHQRVYLLPSYDEVTPEMRGTYMNLVYLASRSNTPISSAYLNRRFTPESPRETTARLLAGPVEEKSLYILLKPLAREDADRLAESQGSVRPFPGGWVVSRSLD